MESTAPSNDARRPKSRRNLWIALAATLLGALATAPAIASRATEPQRLEATQATVTLEIPEVDCAACNVDVRKAVKGAGGVVRLGEGQPKNRLVVVYEAASGRPEAYVEALRKAGFAKAHAVS